MQRPALALVAMSFILSACSHKTPAPATATTGTAAGSGTEIVVPLQARSDSKLTGQARFVDTGAGVTVMVDVGGAAPGNHGVHVHEKADCSAPDAASAGGHYNPDQHDHALPPTDGNGNGGRHLGDLGNIEVGADGNGHLEITIAEANLKPGDPHSFRDRGLIVHAKPDDGGQPTGNAGGRIGCGEIR